MAELPQVRTHFATNGDVLYEVEVDLGEGRRGVFRWRQPWPRPEFIGLFERSKVGAEKPISYGKRGAFGKQRALAREAVGRESFRHPWRRFVGKASPCRVYPYDARCISDRHALPIPAGLKPTKGTRRGRG